MKALYGQKISISDRMPLKSEIERLYQTSERLQDKQVDFYSFGREESSVECFI